MVFTVENCLFDRSHPLLCSRDLDQQIGQARSGMQRSGGSQRGCCLVSQQRRHFQRHPSIDTIRLIVEVFITADQPPQSPYGVAMLAG